MTESTSPVRTSPGDHSARRTRWKTPAGDLSVLAIPELGRLGECAANNAAMFAQVRCADSAAPLVAPCPEERREARRAVLVAAQDWTRDFLGATSVDCRHARVGEAGEPTDESAKELLDSGEWYLTGHQPALFHPGVWVKNFVVAELARRRNGVGLNLIVDNDTAAPPTIMLPAGDPQAPHFTTVPYDVPHATGPWEEAGVVNRSVFDQFGESALRALSQFSPVLIEESVLPAFWDNVVRARQKLLNPAWAFSAARAALERQFGWGNLELPLSRLCELDCFRRFVGRVLADLPRLHAIYNSVLADYRRINRLRSKTHPVPDLRRDQEWLEAPFWVWRAGESQRLRLMARRVGNRLELSDGRETLGGFELTDDVGEGAIAALGELSRRGIRLRTRALTTTLFSRLYLADLFVHGIGGAKYDEMTDRIIDRFWRIRPPAFATLSATVRLPIASFTESAGDLHALRLKLRDIEQHPERFLDQPTSPQAETLVLEKRRLIAEQEAARVGRLSPGAGAWYAPAAGRERYRRLQAISRELAQFTGKCRQELMARLAETERRVSANVVLRNREYAFCLYPASKLRSFFEHVCHAVR